VMAVCLSKAVADAVLKDLVIDFLVACLVVMLDYFYE
jgi:hypothetical protein